MSHAMNAEACKTLERLGYEWKSLDGRHWDWYRAADAVPDNVASAVRLLRDHNEWRRGNRTGNWGQMPYSPAELGRAIDIVCDHATHTAQPDLLKQATEYARDIVTWLHRDHYADHITFEPFDDLLGLLSQIDNMICGWKEHSAQPVADDVVQYTLTEIERDALLRFNETCDDGEGYDVPKAMMRRLATVGVVQWVGGSSYGITEIGREIVDAILAAQQQKKEV